MKEVILPSGAKLKIGECPFLVSKALYQAVLKEVKAVTFIDPKNLKDGTVEVGELLKNFMAGALSSPAIEQCLWACMARCTYTGKNGEELKITEETFEPAEARDDYMKVCVEVAKENIFPFVNSLFA